MLKNFSPPLGPNDHSEQMHVDWHQLSGATDADRVVDFSHAGYANSNKPLPCPRQSTIVLNALGNSTDRTGDFQAALDRLASRPEGGVLQLSQGEFCLSGPPIIFSGAKVSIQGDGSVLQVTGEARSVFQLGPSECARPKVSCRSPILDQYIGTGSRTVNVEKPYAFTPGQEVSIERTLTAEWIKRNEMDKLERNGQPQTWLKAGTKLTEIRRITAINGNAIEWVHKLETGQTDSADPKYRLDIPLTDSIDATLGQKPNIGVYERPQEATQNIGLSNLTLQLSPSESGIPISSGPVFTAITVPSYAEDIYLSGITFVGFLCSVQIAPAARRITISDCIAQRTEPTNSSKGWPADISISGSQVLVLRSKTVGARKSDSIAVAIQARAPGPIAVVGHSTEFGAVQCHARWAHGVLFDGCNAKQIEIANRGHMGTGHGWTAGSSVVWNCVATMRLLVQKPPLSQNTTVGCIGMNDRCSGLCVSPGQAVSPIGLFAQQLTERIGREKASSVLGMAL